MIDDWLRYEGEQPTIDDLPTSNSERSGALVPIERLDDLRAEVEGLRTAAAMYRERCDERGAEIERLREALELLARDTPARPGSVIAREALDG